MTIKVIAFNVFCTFLFSGALFRRSLTVDQIFFDIIMNIVWNTKNFTFMFLVIYGGATLHKEVYVPIFICVLASVMEVIKTVGFTVKGKIYGYRRS